MAMLSIIVMISLFNATLLQCFRKWGWLNWYMLHRSFWMPSGTCYLCLSFWLSMIECIILFCMACDPKLFIIPFCACSLTNFIINSTIINDYDPDK